MAPGGGGMTLHDKRTQRTHKQWRRRIFFCPQIYHLGPWWKQDANGCHRCIRNEFSKWVGTHEILQLNGMSKIWQKHGFNRSQPYPKNKKKKRHESIGSLRGDSGTWGGGMTLHAKRTQRTHEQWRRRIFFCPQIYHLGPWWKQEANGCHRCIRNEFSKWVGTHEILQLNGMSKIWQKHGFNRSQPYPKNKKKRDMRALDHSEATVAPGGGG